MQYWKAHYKDALHDTDIEILNTEEDYGTDPISFTLDNITFHGTSLGDLWLADETQASEAVKKFCLLKWGRPYEYDLQRYALAVEIPINVFRKRDACLVTGILFVAFQCLEHDAEKHSAILLCDDERVYRDDVEVREFSLCVDGLCFQSAKKTLDFETALEDISAQIKSDYYIKCCFTCQYSDYFPYGNDDYGTMCCYRRHKDDYLKVNNKGDFFSILNGKDFDTRQETYLCEQYCLRDKAKGYRGWGGLL